MNFNEMTIEQLKAYKASVETYGTDRELYEVEIRINELSHNGVLLLGKFKDFVTTEWIDRNSQPN